MNILNLIHITTHRANEERKAVEASLRATSASLGKQIDNLRNIIHDLHEQLVDAQRQANTLVADKVRLTKELKRAQTSLALRNQQFASAAQEGRRAGKKPPKRNDPATRNHGCNGHHTTFDKTQEEITLCKLAVTN